MLEQVFFPSLAPPPPASVKEPEKKIRVKIMNKLLENYFHALFAQNL